MFLSAPNSLVNFAQKELSTLDFNNKIKPCQITNATNSNLCIYFYKLRLIVLSVVDTQVAF